MATRQQLASLLAQLLAGQDDENAPIAAQGMVGAASELFQSGKTNFAPSQMDAVMGSAIGSQISQMFRPGILSQPIALQTLKARMSANKKQFPSLSSLTPFDFIAAAAMQRNAEALNMMLGRPPEAGGVSTPLQIPAIHEQKVSSKTLPSYLQAIQ